MKFKDDDHSSNPTASDLTNSFQEICERRFSRRNLLKSGFIVGATASLGGLAACQPKYGPEISASSKDPGSYQSNYAFEEIAHGIDENHHVAADHTADILIRWGDPIFTDAPEFDPNNQTAAKQLLQFGFNNDYIGYISLSPEAGQDERALLCVNHEYPNHGLMFPNFGVNLRDSLTREQMEISQAASGNSIVEVSRTGSKWQVERGSKYNRRLNALNTEFAVGGPAANSPRLRTNADPDATAIIGTINNCAGGITPWGTYLTCEENINFYFSGKLPAGHLEEDNLKRYNFGLELFDWSKFDKRFDVSVEPNEPNRFGWVVEIDPFDPTSKPIKRTALGRFKHEGGENIIATDGRLVVYMGDDQRGEYLYKFVSRDKVDLENRVANKDLLDHGNLYVAKLSDDGSLSWLLLDIKNQLLASEFETQADILIQPRSAADLLGATRLDRPEDVVPNPKTGKVFVMLTNNTKRTEAQVDAANPRSPNYFGHIVEITETDLNHSSTTGRWDIVVLCGDPSKPAHGAKWSDKTSENGWFTSPDNGVVDPAGRLWVATDQGEKVQMSGTNDGLWALETEGEARGTGKMFFRVPNGAELCGPIFADNGESLFVSIQHPGDINTQPGAARFDTATTLWPDFKQGTPPRPSLMAIRRKGGGSVG
jgi:secreted PhoX family phosphatase